MAAPAILEQSVMSVQSRATEYPVIDGQEFRSLCGLWVTGVAVLTTRDRQHRSAALTMNAVTSLSLDPPLMLVCITSTSDTLSALRESGIFCINALAADQEEVSRRCAAKGIDKLAHIPYRVGVTGAAVIDGCIVAMECRVVNEICGGDHRIFIGEVVAGYRSPGMPLLYYRGNYTTL